MDWVGVIAAGAAGLAAVLSGVNLYISGRRALDQWTRDSLLETFTVLLQASYEFATACRTILRDPPSVEKRERLHLEMLEAHAAEAQALTRLRLVGTPSAVNAARALFEAEYHLGEPCYSEQILLGQYDELIKPVHAHREQFIEAARAALGLRVTSGTGSFDKNVSWQNLRSLVAKQSDKAVEAPD